MEWEGFRLVLYLPLYFPSPKILARLFAGGDVEDPSRMIQGSRYRKRDEASGPEGVIVGEL